EQASQRLAVDVDRNRPVRRRGQLENRPVQTLVEQAEPVSVEPEHLEPRRRLPREHEQCPARHGLLPDALARHLRETVEPVPHVDRLSAHEDPHPRRDHRAASRRRSKRPSASTSNDAGTPTLRPSANRTANRSSVVRTSGCTSTSFAGEGTPAFPAGPRLNSRRHRYSVAAPAPTRPANSAALSPLASHRATNCGHASRLRLMPQTTTPGSLRRHLRDSPNGYEGRAGGRVRGGHAHLVDTGGLRA